MERHARRSAPLVLPDALSALLARWRSAAGITEAPELDVDKVRDVEGTMGTGLPDAWLAIMAARIPALTDGLGLELGRISEHSARARAARVRGDFVACATDPNGPTFHGFLKKTADSHLATFWPDRGRVDSSTYLEWLEARAREHALPPDAVATSFAPRLFRDALPVGDEPRVRHAKFGVGRVLAEQGEGPTRRVKAEFPGMGLKVIQARFLEFL